MEASGITLPPVDDSKAIDLQPTEKIGYLALTRVLFREYPSRSVLGASLIWVLTSIVMGVLAAVFRGSSIDVLLMVVGLIGISMPVFSASSTGCPPRRRRST